MKQVSMREFQLNAPKYLNQLPIVLTRYGVPVAVVSTDFSVEASYGEVKTTPPTPPERKDDFQKLKEQIENKTFEVPEKNEQKPLGKCTKCRNVVEVEDVVYEDSEGNEFKMSLCSKCFGQLKGQISKIGGRLL